jgi:arsenate reductase (thioredoxin)
MAIMSGWALGWQIILAVMAVAAAPKSKAREVVFVCEHGTVKSVIAAELFNRLAAERKVALHAVSRGVTPDDAVPPGVARNLAADGFDVSTFQPKTLREEDVKQAARVIAIGVESPLLANAIRWDDIPPASTDYAASRDAMRERMGALIDSLSKKK